MKYTRSILITLTLLALFGLIFGLPKCFYKETQKKLYL